MTKRADEELIEELATALTACLGVFDEARAKWPDNPVGAKTQAAMDAARSALASRLRSTPTGSAS